MSKSLLIIGGGGHASVLIDILRQQKREIVGIVSPQAVAESNVFEGINVFLKDEDVFEFDKSSIKLVNGIGPMPKNDLRAIIFSKFKAIGYEFETVVSDNSIISLYANLEEGVQVLPGAIIQTDALIGANSIINSGAIIEHGCIIGRNNHIAPGATLSGQVHTRESVHVGTGASVIQNINIERDVVIGAGAIITSDVEPRTICYPARAVRKVIK
ncbi:acetyltransferase [Paraglaciecola aquimarina]|uniref:Acetyltransferase n=1 Tax=Paraglaciecola aquimarina TaxID=1235557 RepID=A0ABU3T1H9_9ALTE|nr:acetyltransferase [Paraglaciecola aquimarina]MDU0356118.1 acetyltransferase [Paraglaciecola aquimarina]